MQNSIRKNMINYTFSPQPFPPHPLKCFDFSLCIFNLGQKKFMLLINSYFYFLCLQTNIKEENNLFD